MQSGKSAMVLALAVAATACGQGNSDNVMAPKANALDPADVNAALGPEVTNAPEANGMNAVGNSTDMNAMADEPATNKTTTE